MAHDTREEGGSEQRKRKEEERDNRPPSPPRNETCNVPCANCPFPLERGVMAVRECTEGREMRRRVKGGERVKFN